MAHLGDRLGGGEAPSWFRVDLFVKLRSVLYISRA